MGLFHAAVHSLDGPCSRIEGAWFMRSFRHWDRAFSPATRRAALTGDKGPFPTLLAAVASRSNAWSRSSVSTPPLPQPAFLMQASIHTPSPRRRPSSSTRPEAAKCPPRLRMQEDTRPGGRDPRERERPAPLPRVAGSDAAERQHDPRHVWSLVGSSMANETDAKQP